MLQPWTTALIDPLWYFQQLTQLIKNAFIRQAVCLLPEPNPPTCLVAMLHSCMHQASYTHPWWGSGGSVAIPMPMWAAPAPAAEWDCQQHSEWCEGWACLPSQHSLPAGAFTAGEQARSHLPLQTTAQDAQGSLPRPREDQELLKEGAREGAAPARLAAASTGASGVQAAFCLCCWPQAGQSMKL